MEGLPTSEGMSSLCLGNLAMFVAVQNPSEKSQVFVPCRGGVGQENGENFPGRGSCQNVQIIAKIYKFLAKMC